MSSRKTHAALIETMERKRWFSLSLEGKWMTMIGIALLMPATGLNQIWGNLSIYTLSLAVVRHDSQWGINSPWICESFLFFRNTFWLVAGLLVTKIPKRAVVLIGMGVSIFAYMIAYFSVQESLIAMTFTFGIASGISGGILSGVCLQYAVDWADGKPGLYTAIARVSMFLGTIPVNQFITLYANPTNEVPDVIYKGSRFFSQDDILDKVPYIYLGIGCFFLVLQLVGVFLLRERTNTSTTHDPKGPSHGCDYRSTDTSPGCESETRKQHHQSIHSGALPNDPNTHTTEKGKDYSTREMVCTKDFFIITISIILGFYSYMVRFRYFKAYGQLYIDNDYALTVLSNVVVVGNICMGLAGGLIIDYYGSKTCLIGYHGCVSVLNWMFYFSPMVHPWAYYVTTFLMSSMTSPFVTIHTGVVADLFGREHYTMNMGLVLCSSSVVSLASTPIVGAVLDCGWVYLYGACAVLNFIALLAVINLRRQ